MSVNNSEEDFLKKHLEEHSGASNPSKDMIDQNQQNINVVDSTKANDLQYFNFDVKDLPCGYFYPAGTLIMIRPAQVREIQAYSMVDDNNFPDVVEKMDGILQACVRIKYPNGNLSSYLDLKDQDRLYIIFVIRELTFQSGNSLSVNVKCSCGCDNDLELVRKNFRLHELDPKLIKFFNKTKSCFVFRTTNNKEFEITPPTIGLSKSFTDFIIRENSEDRRPNTSFLKIIPFMLGGRNSITYDGIKAKLVEYENLDDISFQFLNSAVSKMTFGVKELYKSCSNCGLEVHADMQFPNGASGIFIIRDAFDTFIKE